MNLTPAFIRKVIYIACMVPPLLMIVWLGMPAVRNSGSSTTGPTGYLAQLRDTNNLSPAKLGEIDPASETMKLSTLGLRGVAVNMLWTKAHEYKKYKNFDMLSVTVNQIVKLQPNFITVWEFQAHNLSYNVSVEYDDYRDRYSWVTKGIGFLMSGTEYNSYEPRLHTSCGWFIGQKIGRSDEFRQFRRIFRKDADFHDEIRQYVNVDDAHSRADSLPDNWLVGRLWYLEAENLVETRNARVRQGPWLFFSQAPRSLINYAIGLDRDGELPPDEISQQAWRTAENGWDRYGKRELYTGSAEPVRLGDLDPLRSIYYESRLALEGGLAGLDDEEIERLRKAVRPLVQGPKPEYYTAREQVSGDFPKYRAALDAIRETKREALEPEVRAALDTPPDQRNAEQRRLAEEGDPLLEPDLEELRRAAPELLTESIHELAAEYEAAKAKFDDADHLDALSKYQYWKIRCQVEATKEAREAKSLLYRAKKLAEIARLSKEESKGKTTLGAKELYEQAWEKWGQVLNSHPEMYENVEESQMLLFDLIEYDRVLSKLDEPPLPYDFPLRRLIDVDTGLWTGRPIQPRPEDLPEGDAPADKPDAEKPDPSKPESDNSDKPAETKPAGKKEPSETKPSETKPAEPTSDEPKVGSERPAEPPSDGDKPDKKKPVEEPKDKTTNDANYTNKEKGEPEAKDDSKGND